MATQTSTEVLNYTCSIDPTNTDTVVSAAWTIAPAGPVVSIPTNAGASSTVLVSGLLVNEKYALSCHIVGISTQQYDGTILIQCVPAHVTPVSNL